MTYLLHRLAIAALAVVAVQKFHGVVQAPSLPAADHVLQPLFAVAPLVSVATAIDVAAENRNEQMMR